MAPFNQFHDGLGAGKDLLGRVDLGEMPIIAVIGADEQYGHLGRHGKIEFPVLQVPENLLGAVAAVPQVNGMAWREVALPSGPQWLILAAEFTERLGDGITNEHEVVATGPDRSHLFRMPRTR